MNMQAMLKQVQSMQKNVMKEKEIIDATTFTAEKGAVKVTMMGTKKLTKVEIIDKENVEKEDLELLEDMIVVAINDVINQIDELTEKKLGKYTNGMPGLF